MENDEERSVEISRAENCVIGIFTIILLLLLLKLLLICIGMAKSFYNFYR